MDNQLKEQRLRDQLREVINKWFNAFPLISFSIVSGVAFLFGFWIGFWLD